MAKVSPVSIKYMIHGILNAEGHVEKPDVIGALFGQTEGLLGADLEMRELQKEGKIGRIEVYLKKEGKNTVGEIQIPTALDQSETTLIGAAIETIERIGPSEAQIQIERIEDVRGKKRDYIIERAKKLIGQIEGSADSKEISNTIKDSAKMADLQEYEKLPCGDISGKEIIVVEGRADVLNLMKNNVKNVIAMNGTKLPQAIKELSKEKEITLFIDGDRGGKLIAKNVTENVDINYIAVAPDGKEVEELTGKEIFMELRKKIPAKEFFSQSFSRGRFDRREKRFEKKEEVEEKEEVKEEVKKVSKNTREKLKEIYDKNDGTGKAVLLNEDLEEMRKVSVKTLNSVLKRIKEKPFAVVIDGIVTSSTIKAAEHAECRVIVGKNFATTDTRIELMGF